MATSLFLDVQSDPLLMFIMQVCLATCPLRLCVKRRRVAAGTAQQQQQPTPVTGNRSDPRARYTCTLLLRWP
jgi:hypothetical protein